MTTSQQWYEDGVKIRDDPKQFNYEGTNEAREKFENAIKAAEEEGAKPFSRAYAELAYIGARQHQQGGSLKRAEELARKASQFAENDDERFDALWAHANVLWTWGEFEESFKKFDAALALKPNHPDVTIDRAEALIYAGDPVRAIAEIRKVMDDNPAPFPHWYEWDHGRACYMAALNDAALYQEAINAIGRIVDPPNDVLLITAASKAQLGDLNGARADMNKFIQNDSEWSIAKAAERYFRYDGHRQHWLDGLRKAGLKEY